MNKDKSGQSRKPTIGVLVDDIRSTYCYSILQGIEKQAETDNFNIIYFNGKSFESLKVFNECYNVVYDLLDSHFLDYLILFPGLFNLISREQASDILNKLPSLPMILISYDLDGFTSVLLDNRTGLHDLIEHIITVHKRKNLAFIKGPTGIFDADQRFDVFASVLKEQGIPLKPELIIEDMHFMYEDGLRTVAILMDERKLKPGVDFDVIIGVNDVSAIGAYDALVSRGVQVPQEVSIGGFDDVDMARFMVSPLSTVRQPIDKLGMEAVRCIAGMDQAPFTRLVPTDMVLRESCGCTSGDYTFPAEIKSQIDSGSLEKTLSVIKPVITAKINNAVFPRSEENIANQLTEKLVNSFITLLKERNGNVFKKSMLSILNMVKEMKEDISLLNNAIKILVNVTQAAFRGTQLEQKIDSFITFILLEASQLIGMTIQDAAIKDKDAFDLYIVQTRKGEQRIKVALEMDQLLAMVSKILLDLDFSTFHLFLYQDKPNYYHSFKLILSCVNKENIPVDPSACLYSNFSYIVSELITEEKLFTYFVLPVIYKENAFGFLLIKKSDNPNARIIYDDITSQIGNTLQSINLINETRTAYAKLEVTQKKLQKEMEVARKIQVSLLPRDLTLSGFDIAAKMMTAIEVGGDYYDCIRADGRDWFVVGDVSGHGVHAGLIMMMVQTSIHLLLKQFPGISPQKLLSLINDVLRENIKKLGDEKYMTINVIACQDKDKFIFSGMHLPLLIYRQNSGKVEEIRMSGMWLGMLDDISGLNKDDEFNLRAGDCLLLYTDGIIEARDKENNMYGLKRFRELFQRSGHLTSHEVIKNLVSDLEEFRYDDDITLFALKRI